MTTTETCRYRGYDIVPMRQWSSWCVGIYPTRAPGVSKRTLSSKSSESGRASRNGSWNMPRKANRTWGT